MLLAVFLSGELPARFASIRNLEFVPYDWHLRSLPEIEPDPRIVVVGMDDESLTQLPLEYPIYPLPRDIHGGLIEELTKAGARVIAFDVMFTREVPDQDIEFATAARMKGHVLTAVTPLLKRGPFGEEREFQAPPALLRAVTKPCSVVISRTAGSIRSFEPWPADSSTGDRYLFLAVQMAADYLGIQAATPMVRRNFSYGPIRLPIGSDGEVLIRYSGPAEKFRYIPYHEVYNGDWKKRDPEMFRDKLVVVGRISTLEDYHNTPRGMMYGVQIIAQTTQMILQRETITPVSAGAQLAWKCVLALLTTLSVWKYGLRGGVPLAALMLTAAALLPHVVMLHFRLWFLSVEPMVCLGLTAGLCGSYEMLRLRQLVHRILPAEVAQEMLRGNTAVAQTSERELSVAFCDIRNFTRMAESLPPERVEIILQMFYKAGEDAARENSGVLDKFVGDEIMVYFEEKRNEPHHAERAVRWALEMQQSAEKLDRSGIAGDTGFRVGVGVATGTARVGSVQAERFQFTVMGDVVNVASRLQTATKEIRRPVLISDTTQRLLSSHIATEPIGEILVRGREEPLMVYAAALPADKEISV
jgi:adenylate cyclase